MSTVTTIGRLTLILVGALVGAAVGVVLFGLVPLETNLGPLAVLLIVLTVATGLVIAGRLSGQLFPGYNVAEVQVEGGIVQSNGGSSPMPGGGNAAADEIVKQIEQADEDPNAEALILNMNTPGGQVVASEDIRYAAEQFDGPTYAYVSNMCASGGMWIASGCDVFHAREGSVVGSIGVIGPIWGKQELFEKLGLQYHRFTAGEYKDTNRGFRELRDDEREYWQGLLDEWYDQFIETVAEGRDIDAEAARDTEARVYTGVSAQEIGLVDTVGPRDEMEKAIADRLGVDEPEIEEFEPERGIQDKMSVASQRVARSFGRGVAGVFFDDGPPQGRI